MLGVAAFAFVFALGGSAWAMKKLGNAERPQASFAGVTFVDSLTGGKRTDPLGSTSETNPAIPHLWDEVKFFNGSIQHPISLQGNYIWNRNDLALTSSGPAGILQSFDQAMAVPGENVKEGLMFLRLRLSSLQSGRFVR